MNIEIKRHTAAILKAQVDAGHFASIDDAIDAAVLGLIDMNEGDLSWAKPLLDEADRDIEAGRTLSEEEAFSGLERKYGKL